MMNIHKLLYHFQNTNMLIVTWDLPPEVLNDVNIQRVYESIYKTGPNSFYTIIHQFHDVNDYVHSVMTSELQPCSHNVNYLYQPEVTTNSLQELFQKFFENQKGFDIVLLITGNRIAEKLIEKSLNQTKIGGLFICISNQKPELDLPELKNNFQTFFGETVLFNSVYTCRRIPSGLIASRDVALA